MLYSLIKQTNKGRKYEYRRQHTRCRATVKTFKLDRALTNLKDEDFSNSFKDEIKKRGFNTDKIEVYSV
jgi:hypothetical protein